MIALAIVGALVIGGILGFMLAALLTSGMREDSFRAGYSAARAQSIEGQAEALRYELDSLESYGGSE